jgi:acetyl esterase
VLILILGSCETQYTENFTPRNPRQQEKYATPEPGTFLKPAAYSVLKRINQVIEDPDSYNPPPDWFMDLLATNQKKVLDTVLSSLNLQIPVRIYYPSSQSLKGNHPMTIFFHGGGFMLGSVEEYDILVSKMARVTDNIVISVEYRLAPDHPFPAGLNDCFACLRWAQQMGNTIGGDTTRISVMGDSAGGNLATVLTLMCRDRHLPQPHSQVLFYPGVTFTDTLLPSRIYFTQDTTRNYILSEDFLRKVKVSYMGAETNDRHPYLSPLEADLNSELAPALIVTAQCDPIRDGGRLYAARLKEAGVEVVHLEYSGMFHGFMSFHMVLGDAIDAMKQTRNFLQSK